MEVTLQGKLEVVLEQTKQDAGGILVILKAYRELLEVCELVAIKELIGGKA